MVSAGLVVPPTFLLGVYLLPIPLKSRHTPRFHLMNARPRHYFFLAFFLSPLPERRQGGLVRGPGCLSMAIDRIQEVLISTDANERDLTIAPHLHRLFCNDEKGLGKERGEKKSEKDNNNDHHQNNRRMTLVVRLRYL